MAERAQRDVNAVVPDVACLLEAIQRVLEAEDLALAVGAGRRAHVQLLVERAGSVCVGLQYGAAGRDSDGNEHANEPRRTTDDTFSAVDAALSLEAESLFRKNVVLDALGLEAIRCSLL